MNDNINTDKNKKSLEIEKILYYFWTNPKISIPVIILIGIIFRISSYPFDIPLILDSSLYFWYANDLALTKEFSKEIIVLNNGWPTFLSFFFISIPQETILGEMQIQRIISSVLSVITFIPIYYIGKKFFGKEYAIIGGAIFILEPHIVLNSVQGITEPLYIFLGTVAIWFLLMNKSKFLYISFFLSGLTILVRSEAIFLVLSMIVIFLFSNKEKKYKKISKIMALLLIVGFTILPMAMIRADTIGTDGIFSRALIQAEDSITRNEINYDGNSFVFTGLINLLKFLIWTSFPIFFMFVPSSIILYYKKQKQKMFNLIVIYFGMIIPIFYAYSIPALDTRYLYFLFPIYAIFSLIAIKFYCQQFEREKIVLTGIFIIIIIASLFFIEYKKIDVEYEKQVIKVLEDANDYFTVTNTLYPESGYLENINIINDKMPILSSKRNMNQISTIGYETIYDFIENNKNTLSHIIIDNSPERPIFLKQLWYEEYSFLINKYESNEKYPNSRYKIIVFEIDYEKLDISK